MAGVCSRAACKGVADVILIFLAIVFVVVAIVGASTKEELTAELLMLAGFFGIFLCMFILIIVPVLDWWI